MSGRFFGTMNTMTMLRASRLRGAPRWLSTTVLVGAMALISAWATVAEDIQWTPLDSEVLEPDQPLLYRGRLENGAAEEREVTVRWSVQVNPAYADPPVPDPVQGVDHALGCPSVWSVGGVAQGDAKLCDGDDFSHVETPWGNHIEAMATVDLGVVREITAVRWNAGDANWIHRADLAVSVDGETWQRVAGAQGVVLQAKWGPGHDFPIGSPVRARHLRFRFHNGGAAVNCIRLPPTIRVYDGAANDNLAVPVVGPRVAEGVVEATVPARGSTEIVLASSDIRLAPGGYLLGLELDGDGHRQVQWSHLFVRPADTVAPERARRFGINGADVALAPEMRRCGFGWVRFENCKWAFYSPARDRYAFDGSVGPWHVAPDRIFADYRSLGLRVLPYVFMVPEWASGSPPGAPHTWNYPPTDNADYGEAIFQLVGRMGSVAVDPALLKTADRKSGLGLIHAVELWNEPNLNDPNWGPYVGTLEQYFDTLRAGVEGARRADPSLPVSGAGMAGLDLGVVGRFAEHRYSDGRTPLDLIDIVNVHFYSGREAPEICGWDPNVGRDAVRSGGATYPEQLEDLVAWRDRHKPSAELWLSETGNDVGGPIGGTERAQACKLPRAVLLALAAGIDKVMIYRESGSDAQMHAGAGLLRNDRTVRPAWFTVATLIRQLQGYEGRALRLPTDDDRLWAYGWEDGERRLITVWRREGTGKLGVDVGPAIVCDGFGHRSEVPGTADVIVSELPTYLTGFRSKAGFEPWFAAGRKRAETRAAERARLAGLPAVLIDFGPPGQAVGLLKGYGLPRRYQSVNKDGLWDEEAGCGWTKAPIGDEDAQWIADPLERDACRIDSSHGFRLRLAPGRHRLRISAEPFAPDGEITVRCGARTMKVRITRGNHVGEFVVEGGETPLEISVDGYFHLRWIEAIGREGPPAA